MNETSEPGEVKPQWQLDQELAREEARARLRVHCTYCGRETFPPHNVWRFKPTRCSLNCCAHCCARHCRHDTSGA
jgi:hypothetical protein